MAVQYMLVPSGVSLDDAPTVTPADLHTLRDEMRTSGWRMDPAFRQVAGLLTSGVRLYRGFLAVTDALACVRYGRDPRLPVPTGTRVDVVAVDGEPVLVDGRYVAPGAASVAGEVPSLLPAQQRRWLEHAIYRDGQSIFRPTVEPPDERSTVRLPAGEVLERAPGDTVPFDKGDAEVAATVLVFDGANPVAVASTTGFVRLTKVRP